MKYKTILNVFAIIIAVTLFASLFVGHSEYYNKYEKYKYGFIPYYSTIDKKYSKKDREKAQEIINLAGKIMTDTLGSVPENAGELVCYAVNESFSDAKPKRVEAKINLITADFSLGGGYMWVECTRQAFDQNNSVVEEKESLAYWKLKKQNNNWTVVKVKEVQHKNATVL